jgi:hypothetical protein
MLSEEELKGVPLLVFCNKQDITGAVPPEQISEQLGLAGGEKTRPWSVRGSCATKGEGLEEGLDWYVFESFVFFAWLTVNIGSSMLYRRRSIRPREQSGSDFGISHCYLLYFFLSIILALHLIPYWRLCGHGLSSRRSAVSPGYIERTIYYMEKLSHLVAGQFQFRDMVSGDSKHLL